jgi:release factor glutamine methyltransferase
VTHSVAQALARARSLSIDRLDAQCLIAHTLGRPRAWVIAHEDAALDDAAQRALDVLLARRAAGEPLAYLVGEREFHGLRLRVGPDVLVPRPDTETLVEWALELLAPLPAPRVIDLGTGSGAIALAVKHACPHAEVHATDVGERALALAQGNARSLGLALSWHLGSWWQSVPAGRPFDLVLSNPPYVAAGDPHLAGFAPRAGAGADPRRRPRRRPGGHRAHRRRRAAPHGTRRLVVARARRRSGPRGARLPDSGRLRGADHAARPGWLAARHGGSPRRVTAIGNTAATNRGGHGIAARTSCPTSARHRRSINAKVPARRKSSIQP